MRTITLEEHFTTMNYLRATGALDKPTPPAMLAVRSKLLDLGDGRIAAMDEAAIDTQVLSLATADRDALTAADEVAALRDVHDELQAAVQAHPARFRAFATPPLKDPAAAVRELERCVQQLGFVGAYVDGTTDGLFLDDERFLPVLEAAVALDVPIYIHPAEPPAAVREAYYSGLPGSAGYFLSIAGWGWHSETAIHVLRLYLAGVFDRLPKLRIIIGHMGEMLPMALARSSKVFSNVRSGRSLTEVMQQQVWITTSGYFTKPPFDCARAVLGLDRMMYSVDYPFSANTLGADFLRELALPQDELEALAGGTAASLLKI